MKLNNKRGISLIVLVITIIVMIILATAIILSLSSNGIIGKANDAKSSTDLANARQVVSLAKGEWDLGVVKDSDSLKEYAEKKLKEIGFNVGEKKAGSYHVSTKGDLYRYPVMPDGFTASQASTEDDLEEGLVVYNVATPVTDVTRSTAMTSYDQYVWVPVPDTDEFVNKDFGVGMDIIDFKSQFFNYDPAIKEEKNEYENLKKSIEKYGGFYIARYEAGKPSDSVNYNPESGTLTVPVSKKGASLWVNIPWDITWVQGQTENKYGTWNKSGAAVVARNAINSNVKSHLVYGSEWDATMNFMGDVYNPYISTEKYIFNSTGMGWYENNSNGSIQPAGKDVDSDSSNMVKNIYDMAGNAYEWTSEAYESLLNTYHGRVLRGGHYDTTATKRPASSRRNYGPNNVAENTGFRVALYIK